jgi:hypothetical protein
MTRTFVSSFLVPLVRGGRLHVGRPLGTAAIARLGDAGDDAETLATCRREIAGRFLPDAGAPPLDEATLRLGAAVHDLLVLVHPGIDGPRVARRHERIAAAARDLASLGPPRTALEAVNRHSLLSRVAEIARTDSTVTFWLGRQSFVGRVPPPRVTALPALRRVRVDVVRRAWLREIGVPAIGRDAVLALAVASPLGEALDPLRLEPPLAWSRILPALRWPALARIVAGRLLEVGVDRAGDSLAIALHRFASFQDPSGGLTATPEGVSFALRFLAHVVWLDVLLGRAADTSVSTGAAELAALVTAAARTEPSLVWPSDVGPDDDLGRAFRARLATMAARAEGQGGSGLAAALGVVAFATGAAVGSATGSESPIHI